MDPVSVRFARVSLLWLVSGFMLGGLMLSDRIVPGTWRLWFAPTHGHILFVGWFLQFAVGVAYWLLPRKRTPQRPLGYHEGIAHVAFLLLNVGLALRVIAEPLERVGSDPAAIDIALVLSALLQILAITFIATQLWGRIVPRRGTRKDE